MVLYVLNNLEIGFLFSLHTQYGALFEIVPVLSSRTAVTSAGMAEKPPPGDYITLSLSFWYMHCFLGSHGDLNLEPPSNPPQPFTTCLSS